MTRSFIVIAPSQPVVSSLSWLSGYSKRTKTNFTYGLTMLCLLCWLPRGSRMMIRSNHAYWINTRPTRVARLHGQTNQQLLCWLHTCFNSLSSVSLASRSAQSCLRSIEPYGTMNPVLLNLNIAQFVLLNLNIEQFFPLNLIIEQLVPLNLTIE